MNGLKWVQALNNDTGAGEQGGKIWEGWQQRPFHPKQAGHQVFADNAIAQMKKDKIPGVKPDGDGS